MKLIVYAIFGLANLAALNTVLGSVATFEVAEAPNYAEPMDFSVGPDYAYIVYRRLPSDHQVVDLPANRDVVLGIYAIPGGAEASRVNLVSLWEESPFGPAPPLVATTSHNGGVVVKINRPDRGTFLAHVDTDGDVTARRYYEGVQVIGLDRYRDFTVIHTNRSIMLLDDQLQTKYEWASRELSAYEPMVVLARPSGNDILVLEAERRKDPQGMERFSGTFRRLALEGRLVERASVTVPLNFMYPAQFLVWPSKLSLLLNDGSQWQNCMLESSGEEFSCTIAPWQGDASKALDGSLAGGVYHNVVRSGDDGYIAAVPNGCAVWSRRYDLSGAISRYQPSFPGGSSDLGIVRKLILKEWDGRLFSLIGSLRTSSGDDGSDHTVFSHVKISQSPPTDGTPAIGGCRSWGNSGQVTVEGVMACVEKDADPNASGNCGAWMRPLSVAARTADSNAIRALLKAGANPNAQDEDGDTALHDAARYGRAADKLEALLEGGANPALRNNAGKLAWDYARENDALLESSILERLRLDDD